MYDNMGVSMYYTCVPQKMKILPSSVSYSAGGLSAVAPTVICKL